MGFFFCSTKKFYFYPCQVIQYIHRNKQTPRFKMFTKQDKHLVAKKLQKIAQTYNLKLKLYGAGTNFAECVIFSGPIDFNEDTNIKFNYETTFAKIDVSNYRGTSGKVLSEIKAAMSISENDYSVCIGIGSWDKLYQLVK